MIQNEARESIYKTFSDGWKAAYPGFPFTFPNEKFDTNGKPEWVRTSVLHRPESGQHTIGSVGNRVFRRRGTVIVEVYSLADRGLARQDELQKTARDLFEGKTINGVCFYDAKNFEGGPYLSWWRGQVQIAFDYDEVK